MSTWEVRPLSPDQLPDFLRLFDGDAFADNPDWSSCYCQCFYEDHACIAWLERTGAQNRARACERVARGEMAGILAYRDDDVVGWCNAAPRSLMHALDRDPIPDAGSDAAAVGVILCFLVRPQCRGQGIARRLLDAACDALRAQGMRMVEANPRPHAQTAADQHFGPLGLYLDAGFAIDRRDPQDGSVWVRRLL